MGFLNPKTDTCITVHVHFFSKWINSVSLGSWCFEGTEESLSKLPVNSYSVVPLMHHVPSDLGLICFSQ